MHLPLKYAGKMPIYITILSHAYLSHHHQDHFGLDDEDRNSIMQYASFAKAADRRPGKIMPAVRMPAKVPCMPRNRNAGYGCPITWLLLWNPALYDPVKTARTHNWLYLYFKNRRINQNCFGLVASQSSMRSDQFLKSGRFILQRIIETVHKQVRCIGKAVLPSDM